jgi:hypothetical protein
MRHAALGCFGAQPSANNPTTHRVQSSNAARSLPVTGAMAQQLEAPALKAGLIGFICETHRPDTDGPTVTPIDGAWGYCPSSRTTGHLWTRVEPVSRERLERFVLSPTARPLGR